MDFIQISLKLFSDKDFASNNNKSSRNSKFVALKFLVVKNKVHGKELSITHIDTNSMSADPFSKALPPKWFFELVTYMGVVSAMKNVQF